MTENSKLPFDLDEVVRCLPPLEESGCAVSGRKDYIDMCVRDFRQMAGMQHSSRPALADLTISLTRSLKDGFENVAKWVDSIMPDFDLSPCANYAYATRAIGDHTEDRGPTRLSFERHGEGCSMKIDLEIAPSGANMKARLLDDDGNAILPFTMTVNDADSGEALLLDREFRSGAACIKGVKKGRYDIVLSSGRRKSELSLAVD